MNSRKSNCFMCLCLIAALICISNETKLKTTFKEVDPHVINEPASCSDDSSVYHPSKFIDGIFSDKGRFTSCYSSGLIQFLSLFYSDTEEYTFKEIEEGVWTIQSKASSKYLGISYPSFHCGNKNEVNNSKFKITFLDKNRIKVELHPYYASAVNEYMGKSTTTVGDNEILWLTSIPYPTTPQINVIPTDFCRIADCSKGILRFTTGWYINGSLEACPSEKLLDFYTYRSHTDDYVIIGYGGGQYFLYVTPNGKLINIIRSKQRYSLFKKIRKEDGKFLLQAWNGRYLGHIVSPSQKEIILIDSAQSEYIIFGRAN